MTEPRLISADSHVNEPGDLWGEHIDKQFRDRAPRVVEDLPGQKPGAYLVLEGVPPTHLAQGMGVLIFSGVLRRQIFATFIDDRVGVASREFIGVENIMWSSDYPHTVSTWPHSREVVERDFKGVPDKERRQIVRENAARLYGFALA